jgi:hypothetical protein
MKEEENGRQSLHMLNWWSRRVFCSRKCTTIDTICVYIHCSLIAEFRTTIRNYRCMDEHPHTYCQAYARESSHLHSNAGERNPSLPISRGIAPISELGDGTLQRRSIGGTATGRLRSRFPSTTIHTQRLSRCWKIVRFWGLRRRH